MQRLQTRCDELQSDLKKARAEFDEAMDALQRDLEASEKENAELKERAKNMSKKALLMNLSSTLNQSSTPTTPTAPGGSIASHAAEIAYLETQLAEKQQLLKWADSRIRQLKAQITMKRLAEMGPVNVPNDICGPLTLAAAQGPEKEEYDKMVREAESLLVESRKYQLPYILDLTKPKAVWMEEERRYNREVASVNRRITDLKFHIKRFWSKTHPGEPLPTFFPNIPNIAWNIKPKMDGKKDEPVEKKALGIHSEAFKEAYAKLFGNLDEERRQFEERRRVTAASPEKRS